MKKSNMFAAALAAVMVLALSVTSVLAYLTTYTRAQGGIKLELTEETVIKEVVEDSQKKVTIENTGKVPVRVRAKAYAPAAVEIQENFNNNPDWTKAEDGYWYYGKVLQPKEDTTELVFFIDLTGVELDEINIVVIYEATHNLVDDAGEAEWGTGGEIDG